MAIARRLASAAEYILVPALALLCSLVLFGAFVGVSGRSPIDLYFYMYQGAFGTWFSWQNTLTRAAPLILTALCAALPAQLGLVIIGGEGALLMGALAATATALAMPWAPPLMVQLSMLAVGAAAVATLYALVTNFVLSQRLERRPGRIGVAPQGSGTFRPPYSRLPARAT